MPQVRHRLSAAARIYVFVIVVVGLAVLALSVVELARHPGEWQLKWLPLAGLTLFSGALSVKLPSERATISISETFVLAGTVLLGSGVGAVLVALDALVLCLKEAVFGRGLRREQIAFNIVTPATSLWLAALIAGLVPPTASGPLSLVFVARLAVFTALYFLLNSWLVTFAIALEQREAPARIWWANFRRLWINFAAGASIAAFAASAKGIDVIFVSIIVPVLVVIYYNYNWSSKEVKAEREKHRELQAVFLKTVEALALAIDAKDQVTHGHIRRVQRHTMALAESMGVKDEMQLDALRAAALLHDTGKLAVPEYILNKPGPLTATEFERMKVHATVGADILKSINFPYPVEPIVRHHHEAWDGSGYPAGLKGQEIPLGARILSVVDCFDALTSDRPYRPRMTRQQAEQELRDRRGKVYDPWVVDQFLKILDELEELERVEQRKALATGSDTASALVPGQLDVISATSAEDREFNELRRDLPRATSLASAADTLFRHLRRVAPATTLALYMPKPETSELAAIACFGVGASAIEGLRVPIGERISGWAFAHSQPVLNSDASLELGPVAKTLPVPLRYAAAIPVVDGRVVAVLLIFSSEPFEKDHRRLFENAATLFVSSISQPISSDSERQPAAPNPAEPPKPRVH